MGLQKLPKSHWMSKWTRAAAIFLLCASTAWAAVPGAITSMRDLAALTNAQAAQRPLVAFEATVTYYVPSINHLDVQDQGRGIYVRLLNIYPLLPGDRVLVEGTALPSFLPFVQASNVTVLHHGALPKPVEVGFDDLMGTKINCSLIKVRGVVRAANLIYSPVDPSGRIQLLMDGGYIDLEVDSHDLAAMRGLLDAEVEVTGTAGRKFDGKMQQTGAKVKVSALSDIKVLHRPAQGGWSLPITQLGDIITSYHVRDLTRRVRVHGTITWYQPGSAVVLQDQGKSLWVATQTSDPLQIGDLADAIGFPETQDGLLVLNHAEVYSTGARQPVQPQPATWHQLALWGRSVLGGLQYNLVSIEGKVVTEVRESAQDEYVLNAGGQLFTAVYRHPPPPAVVPPMLHLPIGSTIRVAGICTPLEGNPFNDQAAFSILLRSFDDISLVSRPSLLSVQNLIIVIGLLLAVLLAAGARSWFIERKVRRETAALAYIERRRSRILEDINGSIPLGHIMDQITEMVSFRLQGSPCWCQIGEEATIGNRPHSSDALRVVRQQISARSGPALGAIFAAFDPRRKPRSAELQALEAAAGLASVAIETRRLYTDLIHRSEFDLLTDVQNRFSLEKHIESLIELSQLYRATFGLIYIDLDQFKQVNDAYGHQGGDVYLQAVAARMKSQLRSCDLLARIGGDEFAVLVTEIQNRAGVEEVARRLATCFVEPFPLDGSFLQGAASIGIAIYPEDGNSGDRLLNAADAAMYIEKRGRREDPAAPPPAAELTR